MYTQDEVKEMALGLKEIQRIAGVDKIIQAEQNGKIQVIIESYKKLQNIEEARKSLYDSLLAVFEEYDVSQKDKESYLEQLK